jgi:hypothetical protein
MIAMHPPQIPQERIVCSITAAAKFEVPVNILLAIAEKEAGKPGLWVKNKNGTFDVGAMQFNTQYLGDLAKYGITAEDVASSGCYAYDLAAWRIRSHLQNDKDDIFTRAANYHSKTPKYNAIYRADLIKKANKWGHWLNARFTTYVVTKPGISPLLSRVDGVSFDRVEKPVKALRIDTIHMPATVTAESALTAFFGVNPLNNPGSFA